jgi:hypothetical protein
VRQEATLEARSLTDAARWGSALRRPSEVGWGEREELMRREE